MEPSNFAKKRLHLSLSLYYKLLDAIMRDEEKKNQDLASLQVGEAAGGRGKMLLVGGARGILW